MKFSIALNMTRFDASLPMRDVIHNTLQLSISDVMPHFA